MVDMADGMVDADGEEEEELTRIEVEGLELGVTSRGRLLGVRRVCTVWEPCRSGAAR